MVFNNLVTKIILGFIIYLMIAGMTSVYIDKYDPRCNSFEPTQRAEWNRGVGIASIYWPLYWPLHLGQLAFGYESTCAEGATH